MPLTIHFLDVGQGDAILLRLPEGDVLIDSGPEDAESRLCRRLQALGVEELRLVVFTHPDEDHTGGGDGILERFSVEEIWVNRTTAKNESFLRILELAEDRGIPVQAVTVGEMLAGEDFSLHVLYPISTPRDDEDNNAGSILLRLVFGETSAIFMGDAGVEEEDKLLSMYGALQLSAELCKLGHHGSSTSSGRAFLEAVAPEYAVISCGAGNPFGHPHGAVIGMLEALDIQILRTDLEGELVFAGDGKRIWYLTD